MSDNIEKLSLAELIAFYKANPKMRKSRSEEEHLTQCACVRWFGLQYGNLKGRLFAVPNGGKRDPTTAKKLRKEGATAGVSDLILLKPNRDYGALLIEMKAEAGSQSEDQKKWQASVCADNEYKYVICRSLDEFMKEVNDYLDNQNE